MADAVYDLRWRVDRKQTTSNRPHWRTYSMESHDKTQF